MNDEKNFQTNYTMSVLLRDYCQTSEENELLYEEIQELRETLKLLLQENADLRFSLKESGIDVAPSQFIVIDDGTTFKDIEENEEFENLTETKNVRY